MMNGAILVIWLIIFVSYCYDTSLGYSKTLYVKESVLYLVYIYVRLETIPNVHDNVRSQFMKW